MKDNEFALVEEGTSRVMLFSSKGDILLGLDGVRVSKSRSPDDIIMADEISDFRKVNPERPEDRMEFFALVREAFDLN